jgi:hypothetical protein
MLDEWHVVGPCCNATWLIAECVKTSVLRSMKRESIIIIIVGRGVYELRLNLSRR